MRWRKRLFLRSWSIAVRSSISRSHSSTRARSRSHAIPADVLKKHCVFEPLDPRFRAAARLLVSLWREDRALPIGSYVNEHGKRRKRGSRISEAAGRAGGNFLTPQIAHTGRRETAYRGRVGRAKVPEELPCDLPMV